MDERRPPPVSGSADAADAAGRFTTTIPRPTRRRASDVGRSRLGDLRHKRIVPPRQPLSRLSTTWLFGLAALVVAGAIAAALFGLPVRTWFDQDRELQALEHELTEMQDVNHDLEGEVERLQTDDGIREAAREELGHVQAGDNRQTMLDLPALPRNLPDGWPYSQVTAILALRDAVGAVPTTDPGEAPSLAPTTTAPATTAAQAAATVAPTSTTAAP